MFSPFDFDVCTSPEEQEEAARRAREREGVERDRAAAGIGGKTGPDAPRGD
jgi:hypothetical protein